MWFIVKKKNQKENVWCQILGHNHRIGSFLGLQIQMNTGSLF